MSIAVKDEFPAKRWESADMMSKPPGPYSFSHQAFLLLPGFPQAEVLCDPLVAVIPRATQQPDVMMTRSQVEVLYPGHLVLG